MDYKYAYLVGSLITLVIWFILFINRKDLRREMLVLSFATMLLAPSNILYYGEYWRPLFVLNIFNFGIESIIVCFAYGGICGVSYEYLFRKTGYRLRSVNLQISRLQLILSIFSGMVVFLGLEIFTQINTIYTSSIALFIIGLLFILFRKDLLFPSLICALFATVLSVLVYWILLFVYPDFIDMFWIKDSISNIRILLVPIEEYFFHFALGLCVGVMYEVGYAESDRKIRRDQLT